MNKLHQVSILVTCFNKLPFIASFREQLQKLGGCLPEIIVVDDFSNDGSREELISLTKDFPCVSLILNDENRGSASARNFAMQNATRNWLFFWDIDDCINFAVLNDMVEQAILEDVDLCMGRYSKLPTGVGIPEELPRENFALLEISDVAEYIVNKMGYWRFLYSRKFLEKNNIIFSPTFADLESQFFILDDVFFLILVASAEGTIAFNYNQYPVYLYTQPSHDTSSWKRFQEQAAIFSKASLWCVRYAEKIGTLNNDLVYDLILQKAMTHMQYLNFTHWKTSIVDFGKLLFMRNNSMTFLKKLILLVETLQRSIKNSVASRIYRDAS